MIESTKYDINYKVWYEYEISCDGCSTETLEIEADDWNDMLRELKAEGWTNRPKDNGWEQLCPDCQSKAVAKDFIGVI